MHEKNFSNWIENKNPTKLLIVMRAISGSGKTSRVDELLNQYGGTLKNVISTDHYWIPNSLAKKINGEVVSKEEEKQEYSNNFNLDVLGWAHKKTFEKFKTYVNDGVNPIILDNMNLKWSEYKEYVEYATAAGYSAITQEPTSPWWTEHRKYLTAKLNPKKFALTNKIKKADAEKLINSKLDNFANILHSKNQHGVSLEKIKDMIDTWQDVPETVRTADNANYEGVVK